MKIVWVVCFLALALSLNFASAIKHPVIFVPGDGGNRLYVSLDFPPSKRRLCDWPIPPNAPYDMWVNAQYILVFINCFVDDLTLRYNRTTHRTSDPEYIKVSTMDFGSTRTMDYLGNDELHVYGALSYLEDMTLYMMMNGGYVPDESLRGAPYDYRRAPNELEEFYKNMTQLIETTYKINGNKKVVIVGHSMGNIVMLYLYNHMPQAWKDKYIKAHVSLAGPWGGAVKSLRMIASGDDLGASILFSPLQVRPIERAMPSTVWQMPSPRFWGPDEVLVQTAHRNYTVNDYDAFFHDIDFMDGAYIRNDTRQLIEALEPPHVEFHCLYGYGVDTPGKLVYPGDSFPDQQPKVAPDNGDGTVNSRSLEGCLRWSSQQNQPVKHLALYNVTHMGIVEEKRVMAYILDVLNH